MATRTFVGTGGLTAGTTIAATGIGVHRIGRRTRDRKYICSELVQECCRQAGIKLRLQDNFVSPIDLWRAPEVVPLHRIL